MKKDLKDLMKSLNKDFGSVLTTGNDLETFEGNYLDTGSYQLNKLLTGKIDGGFPRGRIIEIYGKESNGKTSIMLSLVLQAQKQKLNVAYLDVEHALDTTYMQEIGINTNDLIVARPETAEDTLNIAKKLAENGIDFIVLDSIGAMISESEIVKSIGEVKVAGISKVLTHFMRSMAVVCSQNNVTLGCINQVRDVIGAMPGQDKITTPGGNNARHTFTIRLKVTRASWIGETKEPIGLVINCFTKKNKVYAQNKQKKIDFYFGIGFDKKKELVEIAKEMKIIKGAGWLEYVDKNGEVHKHQGINNFASNMSNELEKELLEAIK